MRPDLGPEESKRDPRLGPMWLTTIKVAIVGWPLAAPPPSLSRLLEREILLRL